MFDLISGIAIGLAAQVGNPGPSETPNYPPLRDAYTHHGFEGQYEQRFPIDNQQNWTHGYYQPIPSYGGHVFFRPYNYKDVLSQGQTAGGWGLNPQMPYSQQFWHRYHDQATMLKMSATGGPSVNGMVMQGPLPGQMIPGQPLPGQPIQVAPVSGQPVWTQPTQPMWNTAAPPVWTQTAQQSPAYPHGAVPNYGQALFGQPINAQPTGYIPAAPVYAAPGTVDGTIRPATTPSALPPANNVDPVSYRRPW